MNPDQKELSERAPAKAARQTKGFMPSALDLVRVVDRATARQMANVSTSTWERLEARGETPPLTLLSQRRVGYRLVDLIAWLDARRIRPENDEPSLRCTIHRRKKA